MTSSSFDSITKLLQGASSVIILSHVRPDGDAYGSALGLGLSLQEMGKKVSIFNQDGMNDLFHFLPQSKLVRHTPASAPFLTDSSLIISIDTSTQERLGEHFNSWNLPVNINIDHHISNTEYGTHNLILAEEPASASIIFRLLQHANFPITPAIASNLFVGLSTDTGSFRFRGTTHETFQIAAQLVEFGADSAALSQECYQSMSPQRFHLNRLAMQSLVMERQNRLAYITLTPEDFAKSGASSPDTEGLVETAQMVKTVELAALFEFKPDDSLKISLRSKGDINVSEIATSFKGGGHKAAAGINFSKEAQANKQAVLEVLRTQFE